jgi:hypothetical protein
MVDLLRNKTDLNLYSTGSACDGIKQAFYEQIAIALHPPVGNRLLDDARHHWSASRGKILLTDDSPRINDIKWFGGYSRNEGIAWRVSWRCADRKRFKGHYAWHPKLASHSPD